MCIRDRVGGVGDETAVERGVGRAAGGDEAEGFDKAAGAFHRALVVHGRVLLQDVWVGRLQDDGGGVTDTQFLVGDQAVVLGDERRRQQPVVVDVEVALAGGDAQRGRHAPLQVLSLIHI